MTHDTTKEKSHIKTENDIQENGGETDWLFTEVQGLITGYVIR